MYDDLTGKKFGRLTVIGRANNSKAGRVMWLCKCDCGRIKKNPVCTHDLKRGAVRSCGCLYYETNKERNKVHGDTRTRLYNIWCGMKARCQKHPRYVSLGITVCDEWKDYSIFKEWAMNAGYSDELSIDRIDPYKGYSPYNCRWATMLEQQNNRTDNVHIVFEGKMYTLAELSRLLGISAATIRNRIKNGWNTEDLGIKPDLANRYKRRKTL